MLPIPKVLTSPNLSQIAAHIDGRWLNAQQGCTDVRVERLVVGAMAAKGIVEHLQSGTVIITPSDRDGILLAAISGAQLSPADTVSGIILTNDIEPHPKLKKLLARTNIPVMTAAGESYTVTSKINGMTVKTQPGDSDKIPVIKRLIQAHVGIDNLLSRMSGPSA